MIKVGIYWFFFLGVNSSLLAQTVQADFSLSPTACLQENLVITNTSINASRYEWDVCQGDLLLTPVGSIAGIVNGGNVTTGSDFVYDGSNWYGFITSRDNNSIIRVSFGTDLGSIGTTVNLGNVGTLLDRPTDIKVVSSGGEWYAFVYNEGANLILRLDFGTSLANAPTATVIDNSATGTGNQGMDIIEDGATWYIAYTFNSKVGVIRLNGIESIPTPADKILSANLTGNPALGDIKVLSSGGFFFAYTVSYTANKLYRLAFGSNLLSMPTEADISSGLPSSFSYYGIDGGYDAGDFFLFLGALPGNIFRVNLGGDLSQNPSGIDPIGDLGIFSNVVKNRLLKNGTTWYYFSVNFSSGTIYKAVFPTPSCQAVPGFYTTQNLNLTFNSSGPKYISLRSFNVGAFSDQNKSVSVSLLTAPNIDFINQQSCVLSPIQFTFTSNQTIISQAWDFGDTQSSVSPNPQITYTSIDDYQVGLDVTSSNTCNNHLEKTIFIYNPPTPDFSLPLALPICTNQEYIFTNNSTFDAGSNPTWQWEVNGDPVSIDQDLSYSITSATQQDVKLVASIPGCSNEVTKSILTIEEGPLADFTFSNGCVETSIDFTNTTAGTVTGYMWDFGDSNMSSQANGQNTYSNFGAFDVTLTASNDAGCNNSKTKSITIYSKPQPDFSLDLPPFSCSGSPSQFNDLTPNPTDSNLTGWTWSFGDPSSGSSATRNPLYTYNTAGNFDVQLDVITNFGCSNSVQKTINIAQSPPKGFSLNPACVNQGTVFMPNAVNGVNSWQWMIGSATYSSQNPTHVFSFPSTYNAQLTVTGSNGCVAISSQPITVPAVPSLDFTASNLCEDQPVEFMDATPIGLDVPVSWAWEFGTVGIASGKNASFTFDSPGSYPAKMTVTNQSGCRYSISKNISIVTSPNATFTATPQIGTAPLVVQLTNTTSNSNSQLWTINGTGETSTDNSPAFTFDELGDYVIDLTVTNDQGCESTTSKTVSVVIPTLDLELTSLTVVPAVTGEQRLLVSIRNNSNSTIDGPKLAVDIAGQAIINELLNVSLLPGATHTQMLATQVVGARGNLNYICVEIVLDGDFNKANNKKCVGTNSISVLDPYPNPSTEAINLEWISEESGNAEVYIFNSVGNKVFENAFANFQPGLNRVAVEVVNLNPGIYYLLFVTGDNRRSFPVIIRR